MDIQVSSQSEENIITQWIQIMRNGKVIARVGEYRDKLKYMVSLYLKLDYLQHPTSAMPPWFVELLYASGGPYHTLAEVAHALDNPAAFTEVKQYHRHHTHYCKLKADQYTIITKIEQGDEGLDGI